MPVKTKSVRKSGNEIQIVFGNSLSPELKREFDEAVISENLKEHVPTHAQKGLIKKFVEAGLMES